MKYSTKNMLEMIDYFNQVRGYKINIQEVYINIAVMIIGK